MDLFKEFDSINYELLSIKLHALRFCKNYLKLIISHGLDPWQKTKLPVGTTSRITIRISSWVSSIQNLYRWFNLVFYYDICKFADDTTPNICAKSLERVFKILEGHSSMAMEWFANIYIKMSRNSLLKTGTISEY